MNFAYFSKQVASGLSVLFFAFSFLALCNAEPKSQGEEAYWGVVMERASNIVVKLDLKDKAHFERVTEIIATQYVDLQNLQKERDAEIDVEKEKASGGKGDLAVERLKNDCQLKIAHLHYAYLARLRTELSSEQVEAVKDGMTYGVLSLTFKRYMELLPDLDDVHRRWVYATLLEGREHMMDEGSAKEKHARFGKYKGRVNNYMSKLGINMKEAEKALAEREGSQSK